VKVTDRIIGRKIRFKSRVLDNTDKWKTGWTAGGGLEYAFLNNWTVRVEALYVDLGTTEGTATATTPTSNCRFGFKNHYSLARVGLNYKF
jgi:outer membrane immunogenic protein